MDDLMQTLADIADYARNLTRDFPRFFEVTYSPLPASTVRLPHPLVASLEVRNTSDGSEVTAYSLDARNGVIKMHEPQDSAQGVYVLGYHMNWFLDDDLEFYAETVLNEHLFHRDDVAGLEDIPVEEKQLIGIGTVMYAYWALLTEFSTEIDVSTPEGLNIPASQRFHQVQSMFQYWKQKYDEMAAALDVGILKVEIKDLRRVSRLTNRYVPMFKGREVDDPRPPVRIYPPIDANVKPPEEGGGDGGSLDNDYGLSGDGWVTMGTSGG
jgi:hypothetical protein